MPRATVVKSNTNPVLFRRRGLSPAEVMVLHTEVQLAAVNRGADCKHVGCDHNLQRVRVADHSDRVHLLRLLQQLLLLLGHMMRRPLWRMGPLQRSSVLVEERLGKRKR